MPMQPGRVRRPFFVRMVLVAMLPLALVAGGVVSLLRSLPVTHGELRMAGLHAPVTLQRDDFGVVRIEARSEADAYFALGVAHAQDRLWQMDYKRRFGRGRLSEIVGSRALQSDKFMRTLGLYRAAESAVSALSPQEHDCLRAYAAGINAWLALRRPLPPEFRYFGVEPEAWREADSLLMIKLLALGLGANYKNELTNEVLVRHLGAERAGALLGVREARALADQGAAIDALASDQASSLAEAATSSERLAALGGNGVGSNAWAVSGALTRSGAPMLASDPHMLQQLPSTFYLARIDAGPLHVAGATVPGLPVVIFGHNDRIAWGATNLAADAQDLFAEHLAIDKESYQSGGRWIPLVVHDEWIDVAPDFPAALRQPLRPIRWRVRSTAHGPLVSDVVEGAEQPLSLRWTALDPTDPSFGAFFALNRAGDFAQFRAALANLAAPALEFVYADRAGNIGMQAAGRVPVRRAGSGVLPAPGWSDAFGWLRYLTIDELPHVANPPSGMVVSANQQIHGDDYPFLLSNNWQPSYRADRIGAMLREATAGGHKLEVADFERMQNDVLDSQALELLPFLKGIEGRDANERDAVKRLHRWDGRMSEDSVGASIYQAWSRHLMKLLVADPLHVELVDAQRFAELQRQADTFRPEFLRRVASGELHDWCGVGARACDDVALRALDEAIEELRKLAGGDADDWSWGRIHNARLEHLPFTNHPLLNPLFDRSTPIAGGRYTVDVAVDEFTKERGYVKVLGAAYRQVIPLAQPQDSRFMIDAGQSGNIFDRHYDDLIASYREGRYVDLTPAKATAAETLVLAPAAAHSSMPTGATP